MKQRTTLITRFLEWNTKLNLSAIRDAQWVYDKHILDALEVTQFNIIQPWMKIADVGTGWGRPLLALAQYYPDVDFIGIDARRKKMEAVQAIAIESWLDNVQTQRGRIEEIRWSYDIITARAVAYADILLDRIHPLLKPGGSMVLYKLDTEEENHIITDRCSAHHYDIIQQYHYQLSWDITKRILWILTKHRSQQQQKKQLIRS